MDEPTIVCPSCKCKIKLTDSLAAPLIESTRLEYETKARLKDADIAKREQAIKQEEAQLTKQRESIEDLVINRMKAERERIIAEEAKKARLMISGEMEQKSKELSDLLEVLEDRNVKLAESQKSQADFLRKQRALDDERREFELTIEKRVQETQNLIRNQARTEAENELKLKVTEKELTISSMQKQIEDLKRKAEQGSQQLQGEVQELELQNLLSGAFPRDVIEAVAKGEFGGDVIQKVLGPLAEHCGTILWESKRTKNWSDGWVPKLRDDQRAAKAEVAVIVSQALPKDVETFHNIEGIWVTSPHCIIPVATVLRHSIIELSAARRSGEGQDIKMEMVYQYLTGPRFRQRVEAIVDKFTDMQQDLERERKSMTALWAKRDKQIHGVINATAGMYGDLQGIAGRTMDEIDGLSLPMLAISETNQAAAQESIK